MRVSAILGRNAKKKWLQPFCVSGVELTVAAEEHPTFQQADAILVLGGDGTIHRRLPALVEAQKPVLVVPGGSGNDFARSLGIKSLWDAVATWEKFLRDPARVPRIDLGIITPVSSGGNGSRGQSRYFCCAGGAGFDAEIARRANSLPAWMRASGGYLLSLIPTIISFHPRLITVSVISGTTSTVKMSEPAFFVAFANAAAYGDGMIIAPRAQLQDGLLDICFIRNTGKLRLLRLVPRVYVGTHLKLPEVEYFQADRVRIQSEVPLEVHADGEAIGHTPIEVSVARSALPVIAA